MFFKKKKDFYEKIIETTKKNSKHCIATNVRRIKNNIMFAALEGKDCLHEYISTPFEVYEKIKEEIKKNGL